jgi:hypothetical protein
MAAYQRLSFEEKLHNWGILPETIAKIPEGGPAAKYAILIVPAGTDIAKIYHGYTRIELTQNSAAKRALPPLDFEISDGASVKHFRLNRAFGTGLEGAKSLVSKGCSVYFALPAQDGEIVPCIQDGTVYAEDAIVIRLHLSASTVLPDTGGRETIDLHLNSSCKGSEMEEVVNWVNGRLSG